MKTQQQQKNQRTTTKSTECKTSTKCNGIFVREMKRKKSSKSKRYTIHIGKEKKSIQHDMLENHVIYANMCNDV